MHILLLAKIIFLSVSKHAGYYKWSDIVVAAHIIFVLLCRGKDLLHFGLHINLQSQYSIPFPFLHYEKSKAEISLTVDRNKRLLQF
jgi:hypothetical protein